MTTINRVDFLRNLTASGFTYLQANQAFDSLVKTIEDGVCAGSKINLGRVGSIAPVKRGPRVVTMPFSKSKGGSVVKQSKTYYLGSRLKYKFSLYKAFCRSHRLDWQF